MRNNRTNFNIRCDDFLTIVEYLYKFADRGRISSMNFLNPKSLNFRTVFKFRPSFWRKSQSTDPLFYPLDLWTIYSIWIFSQLKLCLVTYRDPQLQSTEITSICQFHSFKIFSFIEAGHIRAKKKTQK